LFFAERGNDVLKSGPDDDFIFAGPGNDLIDGGPDNGFGPHAPHDSISYRSAVDPVTASLVSGTATGQGTDTLRKS
jgi:RTX calcium-binding nonapeptide repeat (4 copies)